MAIPTVVSCSPGTIFTGGQFVLLTGTNFRLPYPVPDIGAPVPTPPPTVAVTFGAVAARFVRVLSATQLTCIAPEADPGAATIAVKNLDVNGNPIAGEVGSLVAGATYARADLSVEDDLERITRALLRTVKRLVIDNVLVTESVDFSPDPSAVQFQIVDTAKLPAIVLTGPMLEKNGFYDPQVPIEQVSPTAWKRRRHLKTADMVFKVSGYDNSYMRTSRLQALMTKAMESHNTISVDRDAADLSKGVITYQLDAADFAMAGAPNASDVRMFTGELRIVGITLEDIAGFPGQAVQEQGGEVSDIVIVGEAKAP